MSLFETCAKLAAYLLCIGIALEVSHRIYWKMNQWVLSQDISTVFRSLMSTLVAFIPMGSTVAITSAFVILIDKRSIITLGLSYNGDSLTFVAYGAVIALMCVTVIYAFGVLSGFIRVKRSKLSEDCVSCLPLFFGGLVDFFTAAVFEEIIFRGYVFYIMNHQWGVQTAVVLSSLLFSTAHLIKHQGTPIMFTVNAFIFGLLVAICRSYTGAIWLPIGLHFGWNVVSGPIFGLPCAGRSYDRGVVVSDVSGPGWLTGGLYSLDAGLLGTFALIMATAGLLAIAPLH